MFSGTVSLATGDIVNNIKKKEEAKLPFKTLKSFLLSMPDN